MKISTGQAKNINKNMSQKKVFSRAKKAGFFSILIAAVLFPPLLAFAFTASQAELYEVGESFFYPKEFDKLVLDVLIPSGSAGESDVLTAITVQNEGNARNLTEIDYLVLWQDAGEEGFQGMGIDNKIGQFGFYSTNYSWYLSGLNIEVPPEGLRLFVSAETKRDLAVSRTFQIKLSALLDNNSNGQYDIGDLGVFLGSKNNGPTDAVLLNPYKQTTRSFVVDDLPPKAVITNLSSGASLATSSMVIKGKARDQGGASVQSVSILIEEQGGDSDWSEAELLLPITTERDWQYVWQNIEEGFYSLKVKAKDSIGNEAIAERLIELTIASEPQEEQEQEEPPSGGEETEEDGETAADSGATSTEDTTQEQEQGTTPSAGDTREAAIAALRVQIEAIQQQIIQLLQRLIQLLTEQLSQ